MQLSTNRALCALNDNKYEMVVEDCSFVLQYDKNNAKALYRRGMAMFEIANQ